MGRKSFLPLPAGLKFPQDAGGKGGKLVGKTKAQLLPAILLFFHLFYPCGSQSSEKLDQRPEYKQPSFQLPPRVYREELGSTALLLCKVNNLGDSIIVWKQPDRIISAGMGMIRKDRRMTLIGHKEGINLEIKHLATDDAGNYICEVENRGEPVLQTNQLQVLVPPKITTAHEGNNLTVRKDSSLTLSCNASGFPEPTIIWQRQHQMLPGGEKVLDAPSLYLAKVARSDAGTYICTADNGVGPPVTASLNLNVIYSPEIEVDKSWIHGGVGQEAVLSCLVYGDPEPQVRWYKSTMLLDRNERRIMEQFGQRQRLVITTLTDQDFGNYSCYAENDLGKARGYIQLSGQPNQAVILSSALGLFSDKFNLTWAVDSFARIEGYRIMYRKYMEGNDPYYDVRSRWHNVVPDMAQFPWTGQANQEPGQGLISTDINSFYRHEGSYMFFALEPNSRYEVRLQARNQHGWGKYSELFLFSTRATDDVPKELPVEFLESGIDTNWENIEEMGLKSGSLPVSYLLALLLSLTVVQFL